MTWRTDFNRKFNRFVILWSFDNNKHFLRSYAELKKRTKLSDPILTKHLDYLAKKEHFLFRKNGVYALTKQGKKVADMSLNGLPLSMRNLDQRALNKWLKYVKLDLHEEDLANEWKELLREAKYHV